MADEVRVISFDGKMLGTYSVGAALRMAGDQGLDLIEIAPNAQPPACKIMDYGKWKYENKKKAVAARKKQTVVNIKEIQVRPRTDKHDMETKLKHTRRFLCEGDKVKVNLRFSGREMAYQEVGLKVLEDIAAQLSDVAVVETPPKREGRQIFILFSPDASKIKLYAKVQKEEEKKVSESEVPSKSEKDQILEG